MANRTAAHVTNVRIRSVRSGRLAVSFIVYFLVTVGAVASMFPLIWMLLTAGKTVPEMFTYPPTLFPHNPNYTSIINDLFTIKPFGLWLRNSFQITSLTVVGVVASATLVAYSFARFQYPGRDFLFTLTLATMMLPYFVIMIPTYQIFFWLHWINTFNPLVVPSFLGGGAFNIFLMRQFMMTIPIELDEAAEIDGAGTRVILWSILLPLCRPALATMAILAFLGSWNNFMGPLIYLTGEQTYTAVLGLLVFVAQSVMANAYSPWRNGPAWDEMLMMGAFITTLPGLILFFAFQRYFVQGIVLTGLKG
jgi:multiple sugar transport system permease protein